MNCRVLQSNFFQGGVQVPTADFNTHRQFENHWAGAEKHRCQSSIALSLPMTHRKFNKVNFMDTAMKEIACQRNSGISLNKGKDRVILGYMSWVELSV